MTRVIGWASLGDLDPRTVFLAARPAIWRDDERLGGELFLVDVGAETIVGFELDDWSSTSDLQSAAGSFTLSALAAVDTTGGLSTVKGVHLRRRSDWCTCWLTSLSPHNDTMQAVVDASQGRHERRRLPLPHGARPNGNGKPAVISVTGAIRNDTGQMVANLVEHAAGRSIVLELNSEGGRLGASLEAYRALVAHPFRVSAEVVGICNSAASLILMGADERRVDRYSSIMVHNPHIASGEARTADQLRAMAKMLEDSGTDMAAVYAKRTRRSRDTAAMWMSMGKTFDAGQALKAGIATAITSDAQPPAGPGAAARRARFKPIDAPFLAITPSGFERR